MNDADLGSPAQPVPARQSQKEATRQRVIAAARELFDSHGYQGTTIREIARHAGISVGSVFTTFASKGEILSEVMQARLEPLYAEIDRVMPHVRGSTADRLRTMFAVHFEFEAQHVRLFMSHIAAAYDWTLPPGARPYGRTPGLQEVIRDVLVKGQAAGDVRPDIDLQEVVDLLLSAYAWTYRLVITREADAKSLIKVMDRQIGLIAEGFAPRN
ncbi:TetR/AcrR family transcriptional regulator [Phenylobacterium sp.]|uniref:TetR/AcrR family transcriptional regulator n=1 Tax=Phenylobacterium sp. TaxID=1871053 RepID=UPI0025EEB150|nr:TetR/AcrR family transcriptional regulator [Phenylobacterium sp.]